ncbi:MAG: hypothetical protein K2K83_00875, partial [Rikenella sp.]|nr:hypothetical protein [Rikenella sp.]
MANEKRNTMRPRFNIYWMWGIIIAIILGWSYFGGSGQQSKIGWDVLRDTLMPRGEVERVQVVNRETAQVWIKPSAVAFYKGQERYKYIPDKGPQFFFNIGSLEKFETDYQAARDSVEAHHPGIDVPSLTFENESSGWTTFLWQAFPFLLIVVFWIFIMRRMSGGGSGGGGGAGGV